MTEFIPKPDQMPSSSTSKFPNRRVLLGVLGTLVLVVSLFTFNSWQANERLEADIADIEQFIQKDDLSSAQTSITTAQVDNEFNPELLNLKDQVKKLKDSKTSFEQGNSKVNEMEEYHSHNTYRLSDVELQKILSELEYVKKELE